MPTLPSHIAYHGGVARWEPNTRRRLVVAALDLFAEQGYDATTVTEIAERAGGLSKMTFFRHFPDKREVLFAGQEIMGRLLAEAIANAPEPASPLQAIAAGLDALAALHGNDQRAFAARLRAVIAGNPELLERAAFKRYALTEAATACNGVAASGAAAISSASRWLIVSWPANSTSRLSGKCRKKVILDSPPARSAIWLTVVASYP